MRVGFLSRAAQFLEPDIDSLFWGCFGLLFGFVWDVRAMRCTACPKSLACDFASLGAWS